jgi:hypothetical protein
MLSISLDCRKAYDQASRYAVTILVYMLQCHVMLVSVYLTAHMSLARCIIDQSSGYDLSVVSILYIRDVVMTLLRTYVDRIA